MADVRDVMVDLIDALRGGVRDAFPEGLVPRPNLQQVHAARIVG
jgi:hypothetical protein